MNHFLAVCLTVCVGFVSWAKDEGTTSVKLTPEQALRPFNNLIGTWRGVGQLRRGSRKGAWREKTGVSWDFEGDTPTIKLNADGGQQFQQLVFSWNEANQKLTLKLKRDEKIISLDGVLPKQWPGKAVLVSAAAPDGSQLRCTIQQLSDIRATVLLEKRSSLTGSFRRTAAVGYTRDGERLAEVGGNKRKCIVTGGLGTIAVSHKGKTYYVCCEGCVQAFNNAPETIIADYEASLKNDKK